MLIWRILSILAFVLAIACIFLKRFVSHKNTKYFKGYEADNLIRTKREYATNNSYYAKTGTDKNVVTRYVIKKSSYETSVILNYAKAYQHVVLFIACFNKDYKVIDVLKVVESNTSEISKIFVLPKHTEYINVIVKECENVAYNGDYIRPKKFSNILFEQSFNAIQLFCLLFIVRNIGAEVLLPDSFIYYRRDFISTIVLLSMVLVSLLFLFITTLLKKHKMDKQRLGGGVVHEFY